MGSKQGTDPLEEKLGFQELLSSMTDVPQRIKVLGFKDGACEKGTLSPCKMSPGGLRPSKNKCWFHGRRTETLQGEVLSVLLGRTLSSL